VYRQVAAVTAAASLHGLLLLVEPGEDEAAALPAPTRRRTVTVTEVARDRQRAWVKEHGLLGLITDDTWTGWSFGRMGATGFFGLAGVAAAAGLAVRPQTGALTDPERHLDLPELLARYLRAAGPVVLGAG
jgi:hypothetical protein